MKFFTRKIASSAPSPYLIKHPNTQEIECLEFWVEGSGSIIAPTGSRGILAISTKDMPRIHAEAVWEELKKWIEDHPDATNGGRFVRCPLEITLLSLNERYNKAFREASITR